MGKEDGATGAKKTMSSKPSGTVPKSEDNDADTYTSGKRRNAAAIIEDADRFHLSERHREEDSPARPRISKLLTQEIDAENDSVFFRFDVEGVGL